MTREEAIQCVFARFVEEWVVPLSPGPGTEPRTPFQLEDEKIDPPKGSWARVWVRHLSGGQETLGKPGNRKFNRSCSVFIGLRVLPGQGREVLDQLAQEAERMFEGRSLCAPHIRVNQVFTRELGLIENGRWSAANTEIRFDYTEVK